MRLWFLAIVLVAAMVAGVSGLFAALPDQFEGWSVLGYFVGLAALLALSGPIYRRLYW
jgi:hypothetical protein